MTCGLEISLIFSSFSFSFVDELQLKTLSVVTRRGINARCRMHCSNGTKQCYSILVLSIKSVYILWFLVLVLLYTDTIILIC